MSRRKDGCNKQGVRDLGVAPQSRPQETPEAPGTKPLRIAAGWVVAALRQAYDRAPPFNHNAGRLDIVAARELAAIALGHSIFDGTLGDDKILKLATRHATLRGWLTGTPGITYHDVRCLTCGGRGSVTNPGTDPEQNHMTVTCPTCGGDGFSPPTK